MLVKPCSGPSTTYITVPSTSTTISTTDRNTRILRRLARSARPSVRVLVDVLGQLEDPEHAQQAQDAHVEQQLAARAQKSAK